MKEEHIALTREAFNKLMEYSTSIPTATTIGKQWKMNENAFTKEAPVWYMGEYVSHKEPRQVGIVWKKIVIREAGLKANEVVGKEECYDLWLAERKQDELLSRNV